MNNYCRNCGEKLTNQQVCEKCGTKVLTDRMGELDKKLAKKYIGIFFGILILCFVSPILIMFLGSFGGVIEYINSLLIYGMLYAPMVLIIFVVYAKQKLKYSKFFNVLFWLMLLLVIIIILYILFKIISCEYTF